MLVRLLVLRKALGRVSSMPPVGVGTTPCVFAGGSLSEGSPASGGTGGEPPARITASDLLVEGMGARTGSPPPSGSVVMIPPGAAGVMTAGEPTTGVP